MTITSIGSSFSFIRPEAAARSAAAPASSEASETSESRESAPDSDDRSAAPQATGSARPSVADNLRALMVKAQEESTSRPPPREAARAYAGR